MGNLLKMERYQLIHNRLYWCGIAGIFLLGFLTADTYVPEVMGLSGGAADSLADIFNGMVYDSTFLLIILASLLALILGQEFSGRTAAMEVSAGHSRKEIFISKVISYLTAFNLMAMVYPVAGCIRELERFGLADGKALFYTIIKGTLYSFWLNSATFLIAIWICCCLKNMVKGAVVTAVVTFVLSLYLGYGMMLKLPVGFLSTYQIREAVSTSALFQPAAVVVGSAWLLILLLLSWLSFRRCEFK